MSDDKSITALCIYQGANACYYDLQLKLENLISKDLAAGLQNRIVAHTHTMCTNRFGRDLKIFFQL